MTKQSRGTEINPTGVRVATAPLRPHGQITGHPVGRRIAAKPVQPVPRSPKARSESGSRVGAMPVRPQLKDHRSG
jgi:hypothetical protein